MEANPLIVQCKSRIGQLLNGKWRLDALIGVGGMAAVYAATHRNGNMAAIKILHDEVASNREIRERFLREAYIANKVGHPGTVQVLDDDVAENGAAYLVMELLQGTTVEDKAEKNGGFLSVEDTLDIIDQTLAVLEAAHGKNIIHRDLKPENLFVTAEGKVKLLDFGIARLREDNAKKTQTGMVMGTPAFMAPEQALGRVSDIDVRTDIWAIGATTFSLLTGLTVHEADSPGEMHVAAATQPARSLSRVIRDAPFELVRMVDRALAYEREKRFDSVTSFRAELQKVRQALYGIAGTTPEPVPASSQQTAPKPAATMLGTQVYREDEDDDDEILETYDPSLCSEQDIANMTKIFTLIERALIAVKQYGKDHTETRRRYEDAFREAASALIECDGALAWNINPYSFYVDDQTVWEPEEPYNRVPYQLFSDGIRLMGLVPGLDEDEFLTWIRLITLDPVTEMAPEDDLVTMLWDASFQYIFHEAIDSFAEGDQEERARFEQEKRQVISDAHRFENSDVAQSWKAGHARHKNSKQTGNKSQHIMHYLNKGQPIDAEAAARAANLDIQEGTDEVAVASALTIDDSTRALLAAKLETDIAGTSERFVVAAAQAFVAAAQTGQANAVGAPLRKAVDGLAKVTPVKAIEMVVTLREAVEIDRNPEQTENLRALITSEVLSNETLIEILHGVPEEDGPELHSYIKELSRILTCLEDKQVPAVLQCLPSMFHNQGIRPMLIEYLEKRGKGYETKIAALFSEVDIDLGLELVRILARFKTPEAKEAISQATTSPHALVRIEAMGYIEGVSSNRLRLELKRMIEDETPEVRIAALKAMEKYAIVVAGPFLVLRIQSSQFIRLPLEERQQALHTLCALRPTRGEEVCVHLLAQTKLIRFRALDETHELAANYLGKIGGSKEAIYLLDDVFRSNQMKYSKATRSAAEQALARIEARAKEARKATVMRARKQSATKGLHAIRTSGAPDRKGRSVAANEIRQSNPQTSQRKP